MARIEPVLDGAEVDMARARPYPWSSPPSGRPVVVGVEPGQDARVVDEAARLARSLGTGLVCVWVDPSHVVVEREPDGSVDLVPVDPDADEDAATPPDDDLAATLARLVEPVGVPWRYVYAVGEATRGLRAAADEQDARLIVVGARRPGLVAWVDRMVGGSVAGRLAHTQERPVLVVPARPDPTGPEVA